MYWNKFDIDILSGNIDLLTGFIYRKRKTHLQKVGFFVSLF